MAAAQKGGFFFLRTMCVDCPSSRRGEIRSAAGAPLLFTLLLSPFTLLLALVLRPQRPAGRRPSLPLRGSLGTGFFDQLCYLFPTSFHEGVPRPAAAIDRGPTAFTETAA